MIKLYRQYIIVIILSVACFNSISSQSLHKKNLIQPVKLTLNEKNSAASFPNLAPYKRTTKFTPPDKQNKSQSVLPLSIGVLAAVYIINPIVEYTDRKVYLGFTKEFSVGWGKIGEHRTSLEYSMIFAGNIRHYLRASYKYDFLLKPGIEPSHMLQGTSVLSVGGGYFTDFRGRGGVFPELTYGYSIRNHKLLFYPHVKIRHTFMLRKESPDITDISFGVMLGIANPFIDVDIRRSY